MLKQKAEQLTAVRSMGAEPRDKVGNVDIEMVPWPNQTLLPAQLLQNMDMWATPQTVEIIITKGDVRALCVFQSFLEDIIVQPVVKATNEEL